MGFLKSRLSPVSGSKCASISTHMSILFTGPWWKERLNFYTSKLLLRNGCRHIININSHIILWQRDTTVTKEEKSLKSRGKAEEGRAAITRHSCLCSCYQKTLHVSRQWVLGNVTNLSYFYAKLFSQRPMFETTLNLIETWIYRILNSNKTLLGGAHIKMCYMEKRCKHIYLPARSGIRNDKKGLERCSAWAVLTALSITRTRGQIHHSCRSHSS